MSPPLLPPWIQPVPVYSTTTPLETVLVDVQRRRVDLQSCPVQRLVILDNQALKAGAPPAAWPSTLNYQDLLPAVTRYLAQGSIESGSIESGSAESGSAEAADATPSLRATLTMGQLPHQHPLCLLSYPFSINRTLWDLLQRLEAHQRSRDRWFSREIARSFELEISPDTDPDINPAIQPILDPEIDPELDPEIAQEIAAVQAIAQVSPLHDPIVDYGFVDASGHFLGLLNPSLAWFAVILSPVGQENEFDQDLGPTIGPEPGRQTGPTPKPYPSPSPAPGSWMPSMPQASAPKSSADRARARFMAQNAQNTQNSQNTQNFKMARAPGSGNYAPSHNVPSHHTPSHHTPSNRTPSNRTPGNQSVGYSIGASQRFEGVGHSATDFSPADRPHPIEPTPHPLPHTSQTLTAQNIALFHLNALKDQILLRVSHELKTPITAILGLSTLLKDPQAQNLSQTHRYYAQLIHQSGQQLMAVVNDVLDLTRLETQHLTLSASDINLAEVCHRAHEQAQNALALSQKQPPPVVDRPEPSPAPLPPVAYELDISPNLPAFRADPLRLQQMLSNLLHNAFKFTQPGGRVTLRVRPWGDRWLALTVLDTGPGLSAEQQLGLLQTPANVDLDDRNNDRHHDRILNFDGHADDRNTDRNLDFDDRNTDRNSSSPKPGSPNRWNPGLNPGLNPESASFNPWEESEARFDRDAEWPPEWPPNWSAPLPLPSPDRLPPLTQGAGLGLLLTQRLARIHGGDLSFRSQLGQGSAFSLLLPRSLPNADPSGSEAVRDVAPSWRRSSPAPSASFADSVSCADSADSADSASCADFADNAPAVASALAPVLIADNNLEAIEHLATLLETLNCDTVIARSQVETLDKIRRFQPGLLLIGEGFQDLLHQSWFTHLLHDLNSQLPLTSSRAPIGALPPKIVITHWPDSRTAQPRSPSPYPQLSLPTTVPQLQPYLIPLVPPPPAAPTPQRLTLLCLRATLDDPSPQDAPTPDPSFQLPAQLSQVLPQYRILEAHDLEQADLLTRIWHPQVLLLDTSTCSDPLAYVQAFQTYPSLQTLPLITLDTATTAAANQGVALAVYPCLVMENWPHLSLEQFAEMLAPVIQVAAACGTTL